MKHARIDATEAAVTFAGVAKVFPARRGGPAVTALQAVDLAVPAGGVLGVIGPSGAGKSTLIRLANGLERATSGRVHLFGEDVTGFSEARWRAARRRTGMIFQHFNLLSSRTAFGNVALPLEIGGAPPDGIRARVERLLDLVDLSDKRDRHPAELSGGQKQRVGIARALATEPRLLLCDEATSALDPETTASILRLLRRVNVELGVTILLITHEIAVVKEICDRVAVMEAGRIAEEGPAFDLLTRPGQPATARLVEATTGVEPAPALAAALSPVGPRRVLRVRWRGEAAAASVTNRLGAAFGPDWRIEAARVDAIGGRPFGGLIVSAPASATAPDLPEPDFTVETLGHVA